MNNDVAGTMKPTRATAWMTDWAGYVDEPHHHDPEVAAADGYERIAVPPTVLTVLAHNPALADRMDGPARRSWRAAGVVVIDSEFTIERTDGTSDVCARLSSADGRVSVDEEICFSPAAAPEGEVGQSFVFRTGPIDETRRRALCWGVASMGVPAWTWGGEPAGFRRAVEQLVLPGLVGVRAACWGRTSTRDVEAVEIASSGIGVPQGSRLTATAGDVAGQMHTFFVNGDDGLLARVVVTTRAGANSLVAR